MKFFKSCLLPTAFLMIAVFTLSSCTFIYQRGRRTDLGQVTSQVDELSSQVSNLEREKSELEKAQSELEDRLRREIADKQVKVEMAERGLVITFLAEVLFDSGKADLRADAYSTLDQLASVLQTTVRDLNVGIEGHTDNVPIKHSGWKSNWELSAARAMSVLHYLIDKNSVDPERLAGTGYGEFHPVDSNDTTSGRQKNRRVEVVILPKATVEKSGLNE